MKGRHQPTLIFLLNPILKAGIQVILSRIALGVVNYEIYSPCCYLKQDEIPSLSTQVINEWMILCETL